MVLHPFYKIYEFPRIHANKATIIFPVTKDPSYSKILWIKIVSKYLPTALKSIQSCCFKASKASISFGPSKRQNGRSSMKKEGLRAKNMTMSNSSFQSSPIACDATWCAKSKWDPVMTYRYFPLARSCCNHCRNSGRRFKMYLSGFAYEIIFGV